MTQQQLADYITERKPWVITIIPMIEMRGNTQYDSNAKPLMIFNTQFLNITQSNTAENFRVSAEVCHTFAQPLSYACYVRTNLLSMVMREGVE